MQMIWKLGKKGLGFSYSFPPLFFYIGKSQKQPHPNSTFLFTQENSGGERWGGVKECKKAKQTKNWKQFHVCQDKIHAEVPKWKKLQ